MAKKTPKPRPYNILVRMDDLGKFADAEVKKKDLRGGLAWVEVELPTDSRGDPVPDKWTGPDEIERQLYAGEEFAPEDPGTYLPLLFRAWDEMDQELFAEALASLSPDGQVAAA